MSSLILKAGVNFGVHKAQVWGIEERYSSRMAGVVDHLASLQLADFQ
jgi:hypothetical protein